MTLHEVRNKVLEIAEDYNSTHKGAISLIEIDSLHVIRRSCAAPQYMGIGNISIKVKYPHKTK